MKSFRPLLSLFLLISLSSAFSKTSYLRRQLDEQEVEVDDAMQNDGYQTDDAVSQDDAAVETDDSNQEGESKDDDPSSWKNGNINYEQLQGYYDSASSAWNSASKWIDEHHSENDDNPSNAGSGFRGFIENVDWSRPRNWILASIAVTVALHLIVQSLLCCCCCCGGREGVRSYMLYRTSPSAWCWDRCCRRGRPAPGTHDDYVGF